MKNIIKFFGIIALVAVIGFSMAACDDGSTSGGIAPTITTTSLPNGTVGTAYSQTLATTGDTPITWSLESGALPMGLSLLGSGTISGTPATAGTSNFSVKASNSTGSNTKSLSITITTTGGGDPKSITITGLPATYQYGAIVLYTAGTTLADVINERGAVAASSDEFPGVSAASGSVTYPLYGLDDNRWTGSGTYDVIWLYNSASTGDLKPYRVNSVAFTSATTTVAFSRFIEITGSGNNMTYSLDGIWASGGWRITVSGSTGVFSAIDTLDKPEWQDAVNKNYVKVGDQVWWNITSTGTLTWSGQQLNVYYNTNNPNVATGTRWDNCTFTMSADGQALNVSDGSTWTRKQ